MLPPLRCLLHPNKTLSISAAERTQKKQVAEVGVFSSRLESCAFYGFFLFKMFRCCFFLSLFLVAIFYAVFFGIFKKSRNPMKFSHEVNRSLKIHASPLTLPPQKKRHQTIKPVAVDIGRFLSGNFAVWRCSEVWADTMARRRYLGECALRCAPRAAGGRWGWGSWWPGGDGGCLVVFLLNMGWLFMPLLLLYFTWHIRWLGKMFMFEIKVLLELGSQIGVYNNDLFSELFV